MINIKGNKLNYSFLLMTLFFASKVSASDDIFNFKEKLQEKENVSVISENSMVTGDTDHIDFSFFDDERKRIIKEIVESTILEIFFNNQDPRGDFNRSEYQHINFENSSIIGSVDSNYLIRLHDGTTEFVDKGYYRSLDNNIVNGVIREIEGDLINLRTREAGEDLIDQRNRVNQNLRVRN